MTTTTATITLSQDEATKLGILYDRIVECMNWDNMSQQEIDQVDEGGLILLRLWKEVKGK